jgi:co-chaperonin GroES (HSP10)
MLKRKMENIKFTPLHSGIVAQVDLMNKSSSGLIYLDKAQMNPFVKIVAVGKDVKSKDVQVGKTALMNPGVHPMPFLAGNEKVYFLLKEYDLLGVYPETPSKEMVAMALSDKLMGAAISRDNTKFIDPEVVESLKSKKNKWKNADIAEVEAQPKIHTANGSEGGYTIN